jgi:hypothetical protein
MSAKRVVVACSAVGALLSASAYGQPPKLLEVLPAPRAKSEPTRVMGRVECYRMTAEAFARLGKALDGEIAPDREKVSVGSRTLTAREARLLHSLMRAEEGNGECQGLTRPQLFMRDGQPSFFDARQIPVVTGAIYRATYDSGIVFLLTPRIESGRVSMKVEAKTFAMNSQEVELRSAASGTVIDVQSIQLTVDLPVGHTALIDNLVVKDTGEGRKLDHLVWSFTVISPGDRSAVAPAQEEPLAPSGTVFTSPLP